MILFLLIITLSAIFMFVIGPILGKLINKNDINKIRMVIRRVVFFVEQTLPNGGSDEKKLLALNYACKIFEHLEVPVSTEMLEVFIESEIYSMNNNNSIKQTRL